jgi:hypothetical protein
MDSVERRRGGLNIPPYVEFEFKIGKTVKNYSPSANK